MNFWLSTLTLMTNDCFIIHPVFCHLNACNAKQRQKAVLFALTVALYSLDMVYREWAVNCEAVISETGWLWITCIHLWIPLLVRQSSSTGMVDSTASECHCRGQTTLKDRHKTYHSKTKREISPSMQVCSDLTSKMSEISRAYAFSYDWPVCVLMFSWTLAILT